MDSSISSLRRSECRSHRSHSPWSNTVSLVGSPGSEDVRTKSGTFASIASFAFCCRSDSSSSELVCVSVLSSVSSGMNSLDSVSLSCVIDI